ncbi:MAG TPA: glycosyltransferase [Chitinophagaceae bacterium]|nr:glycosyltransferase [Chitinophagaceae bacterium]
MDRIIDQNNRFKIVLYCHNRDGLGHIIRSVRIAEQLVETGVFTPVILTGCSALDLIRIPDGVMVKRLTPLSTDPYSGGEFRIIAERIAQIRDFILSFKPDVLVVDTLPLGYKKELKEILAYAGRDCSGPQCVLGLPYPTNALRNALKNTNDDDAMSAFRLGLNYSNAEEELYHALPFPVQKTGIVAGPQPTLNPSSRVILVLVGGGGVSAELPELLIKATQPVREQGFLVRFVVGPLSDIAQMALRIGDAKNFELVSVATVEEALTDAKLVIARCGYNTAATLSRSMLPVIFIPYCNTRSDEQFIRAKNLSKLKNIVMVDPLEENIASALESGIRRLINCKPEERDVEGSFAGGPNAANLLTQFIRLHQKKISLM